MNIAIAIVVALVIFIGVPLLVGRMCGVNARKGD